MTREEALRQVRGYLTNLLPIEDHDEVEEIMSALEEESVLDKIRKEIVEKEIVLPCMEVSDIAKKIAYMEVLKIIYKYKDEVLKSIDKYKESEEE